MLLESLPGVGLVTAATVIAEIGDFSRFPNSKAIGRYAGLAPTVYASSKKAAAVAIARKILVSMWTLVRKDELYKSREPVAA